MNNDPVLRFAELKTQIKLLENELEFLQPEVLKRVTEQYVDKKPVIVPNGQFIIAEKKTWQFSEEVMDLEAKVTTLKSDEKANGKATFEVEPQLRFIGKE